MEEKKEVVPEGTAWTMILPLDRNGKQAKFYLKEMDLDLFAGLQKLIDEGKFTLVITTCISALRIGGDELSVIKGNFFAMQTADKLIRQMLEPLPGELKKN